MASAALLPALLSGLSMAVQGVGSYMAGQADAARAETQARVARIQADQLDTQLGEEAQDVYASIKAIRASAGAATDSPTANALIARERRVSDRQRIIQVRNRQIQANQSQQDEQFFRQSAQWSLFGSLFQGASGFWSRYSAGRT